MKNFPKVITLLNFMVLVLPQLTLAARGQGPAWWVLVCFYLGLILLLVGFIAFVMGVMQSTKKVGTNENIEDKKKRNNLASKMIFWGIGMFFVGFICLSIGTTMMRD